MEFRFNKAAEDDEELDIRIYWPVFSNRCQKRIFKTTNITVNTSLNLTAKP